jgi:hypothetical protein
VKPWVFLLWVLGCSSKAENVEMCPEGQAMDAAGVCQDVAGGAASDGDGGDDGPSDDGPSDDGPSDDGPSDGGAADDSGTADDSGASSVISTHGLERLQLVFPEAAGQILAPIPPSLNTENDVEYGNDELGRVVNGSGETLGFARHIFTPVFCVAGVCEAIQFMMVFSEDDQPQAVYHPDDLEHRLMKYFDGFYEPFSTEDMALLNGVFVAPPAVYGPVETVEEMVDGAHGTAPTLPAFEPVTVRGAVFTVWYIIRYGQRTQALLGEMEVLDVLP